MTDRKNLYDLRKFLISEKFMLIEFITACFITAFKLEVVGLVVFVFLVAFSLVVSDDLIATTLPFLLLCEILIKCYDSFSVFVNYVWLILPFAAAFFFHLIRYRRKIKKGGYFYAVLGSSIAVTLGGAGFISAKEYFSLVSFYYVFGLGFGMLLVYVILYSYIDIDRDYSIKEKFTNIMLFVGLFAGFMMLQHYIFNLKYVFEIKNMLYIQWRNNVSTFFLLAMPFPVMRAMKKPLYILLPIFYYGCIIMTGSRSGLLFGAVELLLILALIICLDRKHRKLFLRLSMGSAVIALIVLIRYYWFFQPIFERLVNAVINNDSEARIYLYKRAFRDFFENPVFGTGLAYMGNRDVHQSKAFALCWYHSEPLQIIGSLGITGAVAFIYQIISRIFILLKTKSLFNIILLISYTGLEMISLVNPGIFCPLPYLFLITMFMVIAEKLNEKKLRPDIRNLEAIDEINAMR